jgi:hypothetical protein
MGMKEGESGHFAQAIRRNTIFEDNAAGVEPKCRRRIRTLISTVADRNPESATLLAK